MQNVFLFTIAFLCVINLDLSILYKIITSHYCQLLEIKGTAIFIIILLVYCPEPNASNITVTLSLDILYLSVYNARPCIICTPIFGLYLRRKKAENS